MPAYKHCPEEFWQMLQSSEYCISFSISGKDPNFSLVIFVGWVTWAWVSADVCVCERERACEVFDTTSFNKPMTSLYSVNQ